MKVLTPPRTRPREQLTARRTWIALTLLTGFWSAAVRAGEPPDFSLNAVAIGALSRSDLGIGMLEGRAALSPHLALSLAPTILSAGGAQTEHQLRAAATVVFKLGPASVDDRNLWVFSDAGTTRYRNRLRLTVPVEIGGQPLRFQLLDEMFYEERGRGWFRNMAGAGIGVDVGRALSVDAYWTVVNEDHRTQTSLLFVVLTARIF